MNRLITISILIKDEQKIKDGLSSLLFDKGTVPVRRSEVDIDASDQIACEGKELSIPKLHSLDRVSVIGNQGFVPFDENAFEDILAD